MNNYLNDDSFFTYVSIPGQYGLITVLDWFVHNGTAMFRLIQDEEADTDFLSLKERLELYPGTKTFAIITNPWARAKISYDYLVFCKENHIKNNFLKYFQIDSFESFVLEWPEGSYSESWFDFTSPQKDWIEFTDENNVKHTVDYLLRAEHLKNDFLKIKEYFHQEAVEFEYIETYPDYRPLYTDQMKNKIGDTFKKDIDYFKFEF